MPAKCARRVYNDRERAYFKAVERLDEETNIVSIVRDIRRMKLAIASLLTPKQIKNASVAARRHEISSKTNLRTMKTLNSFSGGGMYVS